MRTKLAYICQTYLSGLELELETIIHARLHLLFVLNVVLATPLASKLFQILLVGQLAFDRYVTCIEDQCLALFGGDANLVSLDLCTSMMLDQR